MKKKFIFISIYSILLFSCKKDELDTTTVKEPGICVVSGDIQANYNTCNDTSSAGNFNTTFDNVDGINITFVINSRDLERNPSNSFEYEDLSYTTQINNGKYTIDLPAISTPYNAELYFDSYNYNQTSCVTSDIWNDSVWVSSTVYYDNSTNYNLGTVNISNIVEGGSIVKNFTYTN